MRDQNHFNKFGVTEFLIGLLVVVAFVFGIFIISASICGIYNSFHSTVQARQNELFEVVEDNSNNDYIIMYNKETHVMYAVSDGYDNRGMFTLLVNADGTPQIYKGE